MMRISLNKKKQNTDKNDNKILLKLYFCEKINSTDYYYGKKSIKLTKFLT